MEKSEAILGSSSVRANVTVALAFFVTGWLGLSLAITPGNASAIWPPSGIALAAVLLCGNRVWPGILLGSFLVHTLIGFDARTPHALLVSLCVPGVIAGGAIIQAIGGGWLVRRFGGFPNPLRTVPQIVALLVLGGCVGSLINASISVATLVASGRLPMEGAPLTWLTWWSGDAMGVFVFTPMVLALLMRPRAVWRHRSGVIILSTMASLVLGVVLVAYTSHLEHRDFDAKFDETGKDLSASLEGTITARLHAVGALQAFLSQAETLRPESFARFSANLRGHIPGVLALEWIPRVPIDQRADFESRVRGQGLADFSIREFTPQGIGPAAARPDYFPVTYVEPSGANERALGFDLGSDDLRQTAMMRARNTGGIAVTSPIALSQAGGGNAVLVLAPVYRDGIPVGPPQNQNPLAGFALGVLSLDELTGTAFRTRDLSEIQYWLMDETIPAKPVLLSSNRTASPSTFHLSDPGLFGGQITLGFTHRFDIGGRHWVLKVTPTQVFIATHRLQNAWFVLIGGLLATSLVAAFAMVVTGREGELRSVVDERTKTLQEALDQLGASEERVRATLEQAAIGFLQTSFDGAFLTLNRRFCDIIGYSPDEAALLTLQDITHPDDRDISSAEVARMLAGNGKNATWEKRYIRKDGRIIWVRLSCSIQYDSAGHPLHFINTVEDIDQQRAAAEELRVVSARLAQEAARYQFLLKTASDGIHILDKDGNLIEASDSFRQMLRYRPEQMRSLNAGDWTLMTTPGEVHELISSLMAQPTIFETQHRRADGSLFDVEINCRGVEFEGQQYLYASSRDITERHKFENDLQRSNAELEQFAYIVSHDLRQPLRMVTSYMTLIERRLKDSLDDETREFMGFASGGAKKMDRLILDLLEYSRVGRLDPLVEQVSLAEVVDEALHNLGVAIADAQAVVTVPPQLPMVSGHPSDLVRLFQNLIGNAVKYRAAERLPVIDIKVQRDAEAWTISIQDNGIGIPLEQAERAFGIFQRLHTSQQYEGTGIGLAVCRKIVEHHGGRIWFSAKEGDGCDLRFTLPVANKGGMAG